MGKYLAGRKEPFHTELGRNIVYIGGKTFRSENQLDIHKKKHIRFECEDCECEYKYEGFLEKHNQAVHGNVNIFCHYFNNDKDCQFDDQCIFAHNEAPECKFGGGEEAMEKVNELLKQQKLKCDVCEFQARNANGLNMHKKAKHTDNNK